MKFNLIFLFILTLLPWSNLKAQEMRVHMKDGSVVTYECAKVDFIDFSEGQGASDAGDVLSKLYGTWRLVYSEGYEDGFSYSGPAKTDRLDKYVHFHKDGTYCYFRNEHEGYEYWKIDETGRYEYNAAKNTLTFIYGDVQDLVSLTSTELKVKNYYSRGGWEIETYEKVSDSFSYKDKVKCSHD